MRYFFIFFALVLLWGCQSKTNSNGEQPLATTTPQIKYEFSGGAGHYNYAPSIIQDEYGIRYGFICENRDPFRNCRLRLPVQGNPYRQWICLATGYANHRSFRNRLGQLPYLRSGCT